MGCSNGGSTEASVTFGEFFAKTRREIVKLSLREFCSQNRFDVGNLSKLERGKLPAPQSRDLLEKYARALQIQEGSDAWFEFFDLAAHQAGRIPDDLLENNELRLALPILFRMMRKQEVFTNDDWRALIERIRSS